MSMDELIAKLEQASEGSRELDCYVWQALHGKGQPVVVVGPPAYEERRFFCNPSPEIHWIGFDLLNVAEPFTTSLDAALMLLEPGIEYEISTLYGIAHVTLPLNGGYAYPPLTVRRNDGNVILAFCIAALKAREHQPSGAERE